EQVVDRDAVADECALALLLGLEPAQPVVARLPQRDARRRERGGRHTEDAEAGGEDDERRPIVPSLTCVRKRIRESPHDSAIGTGVPTYARAFARAGDLYGKRLDLAISALLLVAPYRQRPVQRPVEELELTVQLDVGPRFASSCRHARRLAWRGRQYLARTS